MESLRTLHYTETHMAFNDPGHLEDSNAETEMVGEWNWNLNVGCPTAVHERRFAALVALIKRSAVGSLYVQKGKLLQDVAIVALILRKSAWQMKFVQLDNSYDQKFSACLQNDWYTAIATTMSAIGASPHLQLQVSSFGKCADSIDKLIFMSVTCCMVHMNLKGLPGGSNVGSLGRKDLVQLLQICCLPVLQKCGLSIRAVESSRYEVLEKDKISVLADTISCFLANANEIRVAADNGDNATSPVLIRNEVLFAGCAPFDISTVVDRRRVSCPSNLSTPVYYVSVAQQEKGGENLSMGKSRISTDRHTFSHNVQASQWISFRNNFDPQHVFCLCRFSQSFQVLELVFLHTEGMARMLGMGMPFSKVIIQPKIKNCLRIVQMSEKSWKNLWTDSTGERFAPVVFENFDKKGDTTANCFNIPDLSATGGMKVDGKSQSTESEEIAKLQSSKRGSATSGWKRLLHIFNELVESLKEYFQMDKDMQREIPFNATNGGYDGDNLRSGSEQKGRNVVGRASSSGHADKAMEGPEIESSTPSGKQSSVNQVRERATGPGENSDKLIFRVYVDSAHCKPKRSDVFPSCIYPSMILEFQIVENGLKQLDVTVEVDFHLDEKRPTITRFGWFHNSLELSLKCPEGAIEKSRRGPAGTEVKREIIKGTAASQTSSRKRQTSLGTSAGVKSDLVISADWRRTFTVANSTGNETNEQVVDSNLPRCLESAKAFAIHDNSPRNGLLYRAGLLSSPPPQRIWEIDQYKREDMFHVTQGMFENLKIEVHGAWLLNDTGTHQYEFEAMKELLLFERTFPQKADRNQSKTVLKKRLLKALACNAKSSPTDPLPSPGSGRGQSERSPDPQPSSPRVLSSPSSRLGQSERSADPQWDTEEKKMDQTLKWQFTLNHDFFTLGIDTKHKTLWATDRPNPLPDFIKEV